MGAQRLTARELRRHAVTQSFFTASTLQAAIDRLGFVQADPIRAPARAQDLILRHRVENYRAGDLEREYPGLDVEEDYLYAYGFVSRRVWNLLHPRKSTQLRRLETKVFELVRQLGETHPAALEAHLGRKRVVNAWGGYSKATTGALEWLHWRGHLRIARRERGVRVYQQALSVAQDLPAAARLRAIILLHANIFAPAPEKTLHSVLSRYSSLGKPRQMLADLLRDGELRRGVHAGIAYIWPSRDVDRDVPDMVRFLAPFDPVVWDRTRFEHLWGWPYRFEAYTPVKKRLRGYYAMPLLWRDAVVGWANVTGPAGAVDIGFVTGRPSERAFQRELDAEIARLEGFLRRRDQD